MTITLHAWMIVPAVLLALYLGALVWAFAENCLDDCAGVITFIWALLTTASVATIWTTRL